MRESYKTFLQLKLLKSVGRYSGKKMDDIEALLAQLPNHFAAIAIASDCLPMVTSTPAFLPVLAMISNRHCVLVKAMSN